MRHQQERGQRVIDSDPYRFVRHPMYSPGYLAAGRNVAMARLFCRRHRRNRTDSTDRNQGDA